MDLNSAQQFTNTYYGLLQNNMAQLHVQNGLIRPQTDFIYENVSYKGHLLLNMLYTSFIGTFYQVKKISLAPGIFNSWTVLVNGTMTRQGQTLNFVDCINLKNDFGSYWIQNQVRMIV